MLCDCWVIEMQVFCQFGWEIPILAFCSGGTLAATSSSALQARKMSKICPWKLERVLKSRVEILCFLCTYHVVIFVCTSVVQWMDALVKWIFLLVNICRFSLRLFTSFNRFLNRTIEARIVNIHLIYIAPLLVSYLCHLGPVARKSLKFLSTKATTRVCLGCENTMK